MLGNSFFAESKDRKEVMVSWKHVFLLNFDMEPHFIVYIGSHAGMADLLHDFKTSETEVMLYTQAKQMYVVITAVYVTGSESKYQEIITVKT